MSEQSLKFGQPLSLEVWSRMITGSTSTHTALSERYTNIAFAM